MSFKTEIPNPEKMVERVVSLTKNLSKTKIERAHALVAFQKQLSLFSEEIRTLEQSAENAFDIEDLREARESLKQIYDATFKLGKLLQ
ncbi:MAG: ATP-dependent helicase/DNAse subunit B [Candidatus Nitrosomirales archaeon]|jgi:ATP-dependent helicase/DNAse subunit B